MQNNHKLQVADKELNLWRYPKQTEDSPLQAWDSADNLLVEKFLEQYPLADSGKRKIAILNDQFGAISCQLTDQKPLIYQDSKVSQLATLANFELNQLDVEQVEFCNQLSATDKQSVFLLKIPKSLDYLEDILAHLHQYAPDNLELIAAAKANHINKSVVKLFNRYFTQVEISLAQKKSRTISASGKQKSPYSSFSQWQTWTTKTGLIFKNAANVFSRSSLDMGAEFLLQNLPDAQGKDVIDLACGNGVLGLHLVSQNPNSIIFSDDCFQAIESAQLSFKENFAEQEIACQFVWQDCLANQNNESADLIICNPPFHQQHTITDHIARQMFEDAKRVLRTGGELHIVGNQHLGYHQTLSNIFGHSTVVASNNKFVILKAKK